MEKHTFVPGLFEPRDHLLQQYILLDNLKLPFITYLEETVWNTL